MVALVSLIAVLIWQNQKDKKALTKKMIEQDELDVPSEHLDEDDS